MVKPLFIDLFCGLFGWGAAFAGEGYDVFGFDLEDMCKVLSVQRPKGCELLIQDVLTLHGSQFKDAAVIVASPPCQFFSYTAMPWSRAKRLAEEVRNDPVRLEKELALFKACFRIAEEAGVPLIVENVRGAQPWVGPAKAEYGSFMLWGDIGMANGNIICGNRKELLLMPSRRNNRKVPGFNFHEFDKTGEPGGSFQSAAVKLSMPGDDSLRIGFQQNAALRFRETMEVRNGRKVGKDRLGGYGGGFGWDCSPMRRNSSKSNSRKAASAQIAKIPFALARHIARAFKP